MSSILPGKVYHLVHDGNSIVYGYALTDRNSRYSIQLQALLNQSRFTTTGDGIPGAGTELMISYYTSQAGHPGYPGVFVALPTISILVAWEITNNIRSEGANTATALSDWASYVALGRATGYKVWSLTCLPSPAFTPTTEEYRLEVNAAMRINAGGIYGDIIIDPAIMPQFLDTSNTTYYIDGTHPTVLGHTLIAQLLFSHAMATHIC